MLSPQPDPPETQRLLTEIARSMPPQKKVQLVCQMWEFLQNLALAGLRRQYPKASEGELRRRLPARFLPPELVLEAYGWDPRVEGY